MKKLGFNTRIWVWTLMTIFLTMMTWYVYKVQTDVLSRGQAMVIMNDYGTVTIDNGILILSLKGELNVNGYPTRLLQSLEMMSYDYEVHIGY